MKLAAIQYLRALAATGVVLSHASTSLFDRQSAVIPFEIGASGVDLFFVISGFIMFYTTANDRTSPAQFYARRLIRIWPLYFALTSLVFVMALAAPHAFNTVSSDPWEYMYSIFFIPYYNSKTDLLQPQIGQGWTLNYEMFFYLIFGAALCFHRNLRLPLCAAVFTLLAAAGSAIASSEPFVVTYTDPIMIEFVFGMMIGFVVSQRPSALWWMALSFSIAAAAIVLVALLHPELRIPRFVLAGIPSAALVAGAVWLEQMGRVPEMSSLLTLGNASYSLYLSHGLILGAVRRVWIRQLDKQLLVTHASFIVVATALAIAASIYLYRYLERPLTSWLTEKLLTVPSAERRIRQTTAPRNMP